MSISNKTWEENYGDRVKASQMGGDDLKSKFYCNLEILDASKCTVNDQFDIEKYKKKQIKVIPDFCK